MTRDELDSTTDALRTQIAERLNVRARSFRGAVSRAGRLLPSEARAAASQLEEVRGRLDHPKLAAMTDPRHVAQAAQTVQHALRKERPGSRAARDRAFLLAEIAFRVLVVIAAGLAFLHWYAG